MTAGLTWTLSGFGDEIDPDPYVQVAVLQSNGARAIEVRSAWDTNILELGRSQLAQLQGVLRERGQAVSAIASPIGKVDAALPIEHESARLQRAIDAARLLGTRFIRIFSFYPGEGRTPERTRDAVLRHLAALAGIARDADVVLLHENEKGIYGDVPERVLDLVESVGSEHLRLAWDPANFVQVGVQPFTDGWAALAPYVDYVQIKDASAATRQNVLAGEGDGQLLETLTALRDRGYRGVLSLEPHLLRAGQFGGFSGPDRFGDAARALTSLVHQIGVRFA
jgi:sugar phosphate isomerase/epimerase